MLNFNINFFATAVCLRHKNHDQNIQLLSIASSYDLNFGHKCAAKYICAIFNCDCDCLKWPFLTLPYRGLTEFIVLILPNSKWRTPNQPNRKQIINLNQHNPSRLSDICRLKGQATLAWCKESTISRFLLRIQCQCCILGKQYSATAAFALWENLATWRFAVCKLVPV